MPRTAHSAIREALRTPISRTTATSHPSTVSIPHRMKPSSRPINTRRAATRRPVRRRGIIRRIVIPRARQLSVRTRAQIRTGIRRTAIRIRTMTTRPRQSRLRPCTRPTLPTKRLRSLLRRYRIMISRLRRMKITSGPQVTGRGRSKGTTGCPVRGLSLLTSAHCGLRDIGRFTAAVTASIMGSGACTSGSMAASITGTAIQGMATTVATGAVAISSTTARSTTS